MVNRELIEVFSEIAREKNVERSELATILEELFLYVIEKEYGDSSNCSCIVNLDKGEIEIYAEKTIVDEIDDYKVEITLEEAIEKEPDAADLEIGDVFVEVIDPRVFGRRLVTTAKQFFAQRLRDVERNYIYEDYANRIGEIVIGVVHQVQRDGIFINIEQAELRMPKNEQIFLERYRRGETLRAVIKSVEVTSKGPDIIVSRSDNHFLYKLFELEVPEIEDGIIEITAIARYPGERAKIIVKSNDRRIDPVGACVGMRGSRVQAVVNELQGEKIDIVNWSEDPAILVSNALSPAEVQRVNVDSERKKLDVILTEENLSKAIGRRGQNVRLATKLLNYEINIMTDAEDSERRQLEFKEKTENFVKNLELDETLGQLLVAEGFSTIDDIKDSSAENLMKIEGIEEDTAKALIERAKEFHEKDQEDISQRIKELGLEDALINLKGLTPGMLVTLGEQKILSLEDFADLASDELTGGYDVVKGERVKIQGYLEDFALSKEEADELIMSARNIVYKD